MEDFNFENNAEINEKSENSEEINSFVKEESPIYSNQYNKNFNSFEKPKKARKFSFATLVVSCIASGLVAAIVATSVGANLIKNNINQLTPENNQASEQGSTETPQISTDKSTIEITGVAESAIEAVALKVNPSVVGVITTEAAVNFFGGSDEVTGEGSGIIYSPDGYIITNYHVIKGAVNSAKSTIEVYLSSDAKDGYDATVVGYNISYDLAVIKIEANNLTAIDFADSDEINIGQYVAAVGNPGGLQFMGSVTFGIISGLNRVVSDSASGEKVELIQTDAAINPGNSGGALVNTKGKLVGVNSSKIAATDYEGMGFAIPSNTVKEICDNIIAKENDPNPYIGITLSERYTGDILTQLGYPAGAVVKNVISGGPAEKSGIRSGDIIVEFDDTAISDYNVLTDLISKTKPGDTVTIKIYRSGRYYSTSLKVGSNNSQ